MKSVSVAVLVVCLSYGYGFTQMPTSSAALSAVQENPSLEEARNQALFQRGAFALEQSQADDYRFITLGGELGTKAEIVKGFRSGSFKYDSREISDLKIRVYGNTAVVTGRSTQKGRENGKDYNGDYRFTRVYVKQNGRGVTVALQATLVQP